MENKTTEVSWFRRLVTPLNSAKNSDQLKSALQCLVAGLSELPGLVDCSVRISVDTGKSGIRADASSGEAKLCFESLDTPSCICLDTLEKGEVVCFDVLPEGPCREAGYSSGFCAPVMSGDERLGIFLALSRKPLDQPKESIELMRMALEDVGLATARVKASQSDLQRAEDMQTVNTIGGLITSKLTLKDMVIEIVSKLGAVLETDEVNVITYDDDRDELSFLASYFSDGSNLERPEVYPLSDGINSWIIKNQKPLLMTYDTEKECKELGIRHGGQPAKSWLGAPMLFKDRIVGVISVQSYSKTALYDDDSVFLIKAVANQCAVAVENARLFEETIEREAEKERLYFSLTHDLLSLINPVEGFAKILRSIPQNTPKDDIVSITGNIIDATEKITRFAEDILVYAKIKSGKLALDIARRDVYQPLVSAMKVYLPELELRKIKMEINGIVADYNESSYGGPLLADLDVAQMERVFINLIGNANKHARSTINISVVESDAEVKIKVRDNGDGVEAELCSKLFDEYFQAGSRKKGVGLGLPSVKKIIELHNGHISIESDTGKGFEVEFGWPRTLADRAEPKVKRASAL